MVRALSANVLAKETSSVVDGLEDAMVGELRDEEWTALRAAGSRLASLQQRVRRAMESLTSTK